VYSSPFFKFIQYFGKTVGKSQAGLRLLFDKRAVLYKKPVWNHRPTTTLEFSGGWVLRETFTLPDVVTGAEVAQFSEEAHIVGAAFSPLKFQTLRWLKRSGLQALRWLSFRAKFGSLSGRSAHIRIHGVLRCSSHCFSLVVKLNKLSTV
jgi:hypothetical protein